MFLSDVCIKRPVFATMMTMAMIVLGYFSFKELGVDLFPNVDLPTVTITTTLKGASVEEMESEVTKPIEEVVNTISSIDEMRSVTKEGFSQVIIQFYLEKNSNVAAQEVRDKVSTIMANLPEGTDPPIIDKFDLDAAPVMTMAVSGKRSMIEVTEIATKMVKENIESIGGVGAVTLTGGRERTVNIWLDADRLNAYNIPIQQVKRALQAQNLELPGGRVDEGQRELVLRTMGRIEKVEDFQNLIVADFKGRPVTIRDIGQVENGFRDPRSLARLNYENAVSLIIRKQSGTNTVEVVERVKKRLEDLRKILPADIQIRVIRDQSRFIKRSIHEVQVHLVLGAILASLVVLLFMRSIRSTLIAAIAIPASIISTFTLMKYMGYTLNNMTMLGLTLAVGVVIDDAIVVLENIFRHMEEKKQSPLEAASSGTKEIALAVMATTLSLVIIFLPVAFMQGRVGRFFNNYGITVAFAIMVSLFISFTLTPMLCSRFLKVKAHSPREKTGNPSGSSVTTSKESLFYRVIDIVYGRILIWSLRHRWAICLIALAIVFSTSPLGKRIGKDFVPYDDQSEFGIAVLMPEGSTLARTGELMKQIEADMKGLRGVKTIFTSIGETASKSQEGDVTQVSMYIGLEDLEKRKFSQFDVMKDTRKVMARYPELRSSVQNLSMVSSSAFRNQPVNFNLRGPDLDKLTFYSEEIMTRMKTIPGLVDVDSTLAIRKPELRVKVDRKKASDLGIRIEDVATSLRTLVGGEKVSRYKEGADQYDVWLRLDRKYRDNEAVIEQLLIPSSRAGLTRLNNIAWLSEDIGPSQIDRQNRQRQVTVLANLDGLPLGDAMGKIREIVKGIDLPIDYQTDFTGRGKILMETFENFLVAFMLSVIFMYMVLAAQFESFIHPITIMLALPLCIPFALISLLFLGESLNIYSIFGLFMLFGIVKKNGILQIDYTNTLRKAGMERDRAIIEANHARLRPILMTTITLIAGMIPLALGQGAGAASRAAMAKVIIGGQGLSLLITLLITPVAYSLFDDLARLRMLSWVKGRMKFAYSSAKNLLFW